MAQEQTCLPPAEPLKVMTFLAGHFSYPEVSQTEYALLNVLKKANLFLFPPILNSLSVHTTVT